MTTNTSEKLLIQIDDLVREMTEEEQKLHLNSIKVIQLAQDSQLQAKESALAKLAKLGLTEEEIASL